MDYVGPTKAQVRTIVSEHFAEQFERGHSVVDTSAGLDRLHGQLVAAAQAYEAGPQQQRQAVCDAIMATCEFLRGQGFGHAVTVPLSRVLWAIVDLCNQNRPDPLFSEKPRKTKPRRGMHESVRQGQLAAFADVWLEAHDADEGDVAAKLKRAARRISGAHFGRVGDTELNSARSYRARAEPEDIVVGAYSQLREALLAEANTAGGAEGGLRAAIEAQINALNARAELGTE